MCVCMSSLTNSPKNLLPCPLSDGIKKIAVIRARRFPERVCGVRFIILYSTRTVCGDVKQFLNLRGEVLLVVYYVIDSAVE